MKRIQSTFIGSLSLVTLLLLASIHHAFAAAGTSSGLNISNQATIHYEIGGINQSAITSNTVSFTVDAVVDLSVTGLTNINVTPASSSNALKFTISNNGNETYDFNLDFAAGTEAFTTTGLAIHLDSNSNGNWDGVGTDLPGTNLDNLVADASAVVWLVGDIPATALNNQVSTYHLMATALLESGLAIPAETTDIETSKQYVYADGAGPHASDNARDTKHSASLNFVIQSASLTINKSSSVIWDPINLDASPRYISGAIVEYTIQISNGVGAEVANSIVFTDILDSNLKMPTDDARKYEAGKSIKLTAPNLYGGTTTNLTDANDADEATVTGQTISITGIALNANQTAVVKILAEIQ